MLRSIIFCLCISVSFFLTAQDEFITKWNVEDDGEKLVIPVQAGFVYDYVVDWGDGTSSESFTTEASHIYQSSGHYVVKITGKFPSIYLNDGTEAIKLLEIQQWGTIKWGAMNNAFYGAEKMQITAIDVPNLSLVTSLSAAFRECSTMNADLSGWDVGNVQSLSFTFSDAEKFNGNISNWNTSNVQSLSSTFDGAAEFNQDISSWDVSQVGNMGGTFKDAIVFNQPLNNWDVSNVTIFIATFENATSFNQPLSEWNTESAVFMASMFEGASSFNQYVGTWNVTSVTLMSDMFRNASSFNRPLHDWEIEQVTSLSNFLTGSNYGVSNYEKTLIFWAVNITRDNVTLGAGDLTCCDCVGREILISDKNWQILDGGKTCNRPYIFTIRTQSPNEIISGIGRPFSLSTFSVDWENDGIIDEVDVDRNMAGTLSHTYPKSGDHQIAIYIDTWTLNIAPWLKEKYISIDQWGDVLWVYVEGGFSDLPNFEYKANDHPKLDDGVTSLNGMFQRCSITDGNMGDWDVSNITDMSYMFDSAYVFNGDLSGWSWRTGNVENMARMFSEAYAFNNGVDTWDVRNVSNFAYMFSNARAFNQPLNSWRFKSSGDIEMGFMFREAYSFNQPLDDWNTEAVVGMWGMFSWSAFNQNINSWDVSSVGNFRDMFHGAWAFNQPLSNWRFGTDPTQFALGRLDMGRMFKSAASFNQDLDEWNVEIVGLMEEMFMGASSFNGNLDGWLTSTLAFVDDMFHGASAFNQPLNHFNTSRFRSTRSMFEDASSFSQPLSNWNMTLVTDMTKMFEGASAFNQDLSFWNVRGATDMTEMFHDASSFDQSLAEWDPINATNMTDMLSGTALSTEHYDATLESWANRDSNSPDHLQDDVPLGADGLNYCSALLFRAALEFDGWTITGDMRNCTMTGPCTSSRPNNYIGPDGGDWHDSTNWARGFIPDECDEVLIGLDKAVSLSGDAVCYTIDVFPGSSLTVDGHELIVSAMISN